MTDIVIMAFILGGASYLIVRDIITYIVLNSEGNK